MTWDFLTHWNIVCKPELIFIPLIKQSSLIKHHKDEIHEFGSILHLHEKLVLIILKYTIGSAVLLLPNISVIIMGLTLARVTESTMKEPLQIPNFVYN